MVVIYALNGLSPRGRGNHCQPCKLSRVLRSIPAWAGEPGPGGWCRWGIAVYPRVGGGTKTRTLMRRFSIGLSPRGRGNHLWSPYIPAPFRSIPAWAGEPWPPTTTMTACTVYPRVGGGTVSPALAAMNLTGLSPRGRGNHDLITALSMVDGSIPAWAGEPPISSVSLPGPGVYPRVGGRTAVKPIWFRFSQGLSPRGRGNPGRMLRARVGSRSIPAWAGEPHCAGRDWGRSWVYPRVGGGTGRSCPLIRSFMGLSPRGRGNRWWWPWCPGHCRSIPAWAGEPGRPAPRARASTVYPRVGGGT